MELEELTRRYSREQKVENKHLMMDVVKFKRTQYSIRQ